MKQMKDNLKQCKDLSLAQLAVANGNGKAVNTSQTHIRLTLGRRKGGCCIILSVMVHRSNNTRSKGHEPSSIKHYLSLFTYFPANKKVIW